MPKKTAAELDREIAVALAGKPICAGLDAEGITTVPLTEAKRRSSAEFERCYGGDPDGRTKRKAGDSKEERWRSFPIDEVRGREFKLDSFKWLKEESLEDADELPEPEELITDAVGELEEAVAELNQALALLENGGKA